MITGSTLRDAIISGANNISNQKERINALNVFPVPDGDTGSNMSMTMSAAKQELLTLPDDVSAEKVANVAASALLRGARGNSGVITSLLFRGFAKGIANSATITAELLCNGLRLGAQAAYKAVMKPTEGTMLTVARVASEKLEECIASTASAVNAFKVVLDAAREALENTPKQLPILAKAGVVDSGGAGLVCIYEGMLKVFLGEEAIQPAEPERVGNTTLSISQRVEDIEFIDDYSTEDITFGYCTEFIVVKSEPVEALPLRAALEELGDSVVAVDDDEIIKCHVHTNNPGKALEEGLKYGSLTKIKIDNMREELEHRRSKSGGDSSGIRTAENTGSSEYSIVAVASGEGITGLFLDSGAYAVVQGGQTMNPSTEELLTAIEACKTNTVFVMPNNKNIIMASEQAARLSSKNVVVIPTTSIPQGLAATLAFDADVSADDNAVAMKNVLENTQTGLITYAARSSNIDGRSIAEGELMGMLDGKILLTDNDITICTLKLVQTMLKKGGSTVTIFTGCDVSEKQADDIEKMLSAKLPQMDIMVINGGQPVYYAIIWVE